MKVRTLLGPAFAAISVLTLAVSALAQDKKLDVGDQAPGLDIELWAKGDETTLESGNVYVVEFWATWCTPCKKSIPHLTSLQKDYKDKGLTIIGISDEEPDKVKSFANQMGSKMEYTVAADRRDGTKRAWLQAAGLTTIPSAFIVDRKGKIAWIGNPLDEDFDSTLKRVMSGRYDPKLEKAAVPALRGAANARKARDWRLANKYYDEVVALDPAVFAAVALDKFEMLLIDKDDPKAASDYARKLMNEEFANDGEALQMLAEKIALDPKVADKSKRDLDLALEISEAARKVIGNDDPTALAGVALIRYNRGEIDQAIELQKQAYFNAVPKAKPAFKRQLEIYQQQGQRQANMKAKPPQ
jgi:thiol-disulfide isomerase/thioredoxin